MTKDLIVNLIGGSGYTGGEMLRLIISHPFLNIGEVTSRKYSGKRISSVHPNLRGILDEKFVEKTSNESDVLCFATPHGESMKIIDDYLDNGTRIIDLSSDFRLKNPNDYLKYYGISHPHEDILAQFVYGLPEIHRDEIKKSNHIACPGCIATASILALYPLVKSQLIDDEILIDGKIGSSAAGGAPSLSTHHAERCNVVRAYKPFGHRHIAEINQELTDSSNPTLNINLSVYAIELVRGISIACYANTVNGIEKKDIWKSYRQFYKNEPFIRIISERSGIYRNPEPKVVTGTNYCDLGFVLPPKEKRVIVFSAIDNLTRGSGGQGIQCLNIMNNWDECTGLDFPGLHPI